MRRSSLYLHFPRWSTIPFHYQFLHFFLPRLVLLHPSHGVRNGILVMLDLGPRVGFIQAFHFLFDFVLMVGGDHLPKGPLPSFHFGSRARCALSLGITVISKPIYNFLQNFNQKINCPKLFEYFTIGRSLYRFLRNLSTSGANSVAYSNLASRPTLVRNSASFVLRNSAQGSGHHKTIL